MIKIPPPPINTTKPRRKAMIGPLPASVENTFNDKSDAQKGSVKVGHELSNSVARGEVGLEGKMSLGSSELT